MRTKLVAEYQLSELPTSVNQSYVFSRHKVRPTKKLNSFKKHASIELEEQKVIKLLKNTPYLLDIEFYFPLYNKGFSSGKAQTLFKKKDVSNMIKSVEDLVTKLSDIDDSQIIEVHCQKFDCIDNRTVVRLFQIETEEETC